MNLEVIGDLGRVREVYEKAKRVREVDAMYSSLNLWLVSATDRHFSTMCINRGIRFPGYDKSSESDVGLSTADYLVELNKIANECLGLKAMNPPHKLVPNIQSLEREINIQMGYARTRTT